MRKYEELDKRDRKIKSLVEDIPAMLNYYKLEKLENMTSSIAEKVIERKTNGTK